MSNYCFSAYIYMTNLDEYFTADGKLKNKETVISGDFTSNLKQQWQVKQGEILTIKCIFSASASSFVINGGTLIIADGAILTVDCIVYTDKGSTTIEQNAGLYANYIDMYSNGGNELRVHGKIALNSLFARGNSVISDGDMIVDTPPKNDVTKLLLFASTMILSYVMWNKRKKLFT
jgi:hypothetical protein